MPSNFSAFEVIGLDFGVNCVQNIHAEVGIKRLELLYRSGNGRPLITAVEPDSILQLLLCLADVDFVVVGRACYPIDEERSLGQFVAG